MQRGRPEVTNPREFDAPRVSAPLSKHPAVRILRRQTYLRPHFFAEDLFSLGDTASLSICRRPRHIRVGSRAAARTYVAWDLPLSLPCLHPTLPDRRDSGRAPLHRDHLHPPLCIPRARFPL